MSNESLVTWGQQHFGGLELGDARRSARLPELMDAKTPVPATPFQSILSDPDHIVGILDIELDPNSCFPIHGRVAQMKNFAS